MRKIEKRIAALELVKPSIESVNFLIEFISPGNWYPTHSYILGDGQIWQHQPGKSEQELINLASREYAGLPRSSLNQPKQKDDKSQLLK